MKRKNNYAGIITLLIFLLIIGGAFFVYSSKQFSRKKPKIIVNNTIYWNLKKPLKIILKDDSGIKFAQAILSDGKNNLVLANKIYKTINKKCILSIKPPKNNFILNKNNFTMKIEAVDMSKWNFFSGNKAIKTIHIIIDQKSPEVYTISSSYGIRRGGSAVVIFYANDKNLKKLYIQTSFGKKFIPTPFYKKGYYISLLAWPVRAKNFRANVVAIDKANNIAKAYIPLYLKPPRFRKVTIQIKDSFLNNKVATFIHNNAPKISSESPSKQFIYTEVTERKINEDLISKITSKTDSQMITNFHLKPFYPLIDAEKVAGFGDFRTYFYKGQKICTSYHLGVDLASIARAKIRSSNKGIVVFAHFNGIYGNNMIIYHGLGLYSLYGHCSKFLVQKGDQVKTNQVIARTGQTGMALGDHLHFGIYIQGVAVSPIEWFDKHWMKINIFNIIKNSKKIIDKN